MLYKASRLFLPLALAATVTAAGISPVTVGNDDESSRSEIRARQILKHHLDRHEFPGAVLTLREPSGSTFTITAGVADVNQPGVQPDPDTPWIIGSATKTFIAVVVLQLVREGKLDLDATIRDFFPDLPSVSRITPRQLLQHTSGLNEYLHTESIDSDARRKWSANELITIAVARGPIAEPGTEFHYSNTNYLVLGEIIKKVTSRPWYVEVRRRILEPLGLKHTGYAGEHLAIQLGTGYIIEHGAFVEATDRWHPSIGGAAGGMYSTTGDLSDFALALFEGRLLDARRMAEMKIFIPGEDYGYVEHAYGLGLERYILNDLIVFGHMGTGSAHGSFIGYDPATHTVVAVQINAANPGPAAFIGAEVLAEAAGKDISPPPMPSASVGFSLFPYRTLKRVGSGERIGEIRITTQRVNLMYPIVVNGGRTRLELSVGYQRLQFNYRDFNYPLKSVQAINATAFLTQKITNTWGLILVVAPGYADDFEGKASLNAVTSTFVAAGTHRFSDDLEVGFGMAIQNVFGEPLPLPVASLNWTITDRLWLKSILPLNTELTWLPIDAIGLRASLQVSGNSYHGAESIYGVNNPQLNYSAVAADLGARWFVLPFLNVTVHGGYTLYRRFEFADGRNPVPNGEFELSNGAVFGVDLGIGQ